MSDVAFLRSRLFAVIALALVFVAAAAARLVTYGARAATIQNGKPTEVSPVRLRAFAHGRVVYWAGFAKSMKLELTKTNRGVFVRYLPKSVRIGDRRALFTTVGTYSAPRGYEEATHARGRAGMVTRRGPSGQVVVWSKSRPTSVYLAKRGSTWLVEVFDPRAARARTLALSGTINPVR